jgi:prophage antirepressor-like protein
VSSKEGIFEMPSFSPINNNRISKVEFLNTNPQIFKFAEKFEIRSIIDKNGNPWFVARDICKVLEISNPSDAYKRLDAKQKTRVELGYPGQMISTTIISEPGLYDLVLKSYKPEAIKFRDWIYEDVLPSIRKTGSYSLPGAQPKQEISIADLSKILENLSASQLIQAESIKELIEFRKKAESNINWLYKESQKTKDELVKRLNEQERIINSIQSNAAVNNYKDQFASNIKVSVVAEVSVSQYLNNIGRKRSSLVSIVHISNALTKAQRNAGMLYNHYSGSTKIFPVELLDQYFKAYPHHLK